jgi:hypothetical protein
LVYKLYLSKTFHQQEQISVVWCKLNLHIIFENRD